MIIADSVADFRRLHDGKSPSVVLVSSAAAIILARQETLPAVYEGVQIRLIPVKETPNFAAKGTGTGIALIHSELPGGRLSVLVFEVA